MLSLTRLFLHHWLRFNAQVIDVDGGLYLAGQDHDGLAALDAIQLALVADPAQLRFSRHPRGGFTYDVDSYARGRVGETQWLRPGNTVSYVALEFTDKRGGGLLTLGVCLEAGSHRPVEQTFFILPEALNPNVFVTTGRPLPRIELKALLRNRRGAKFFERATDYQAELLNQLGGLDERFFHLFPRALRFEPPRAVDEFVSAWLLADQPLDLTPLRRARERLGPLQAEVELIEKRIAGLQTVLDGQADARRLTLQRDQQAVLATLLRVAAATKHAEFIQQQIAQTQEQLKLTNHQYTDSQTAISETESKLREVERLLFEAGQARRRSELQLRLDQATREADETRARWTALRRDLTSAADSLRPLLGKLDDDSALRAWLDGIAATAPDAPPAPALSSATEETASHLEAASTGIKEMRVRLVEQISALRVRSESLNRELAGLRDHLLPYPPNVAKLLEVITPIIGRRPPLLCELLEIPDPRWQDAVEAMLGPRRFEAIVSLTWLDDAQRALNKAGLLDAGLLDFASPDKDARPALPGSLAEQVTTEYPDLRDYVNAMLGDIITCSSADDLRRHRRAITPEVKVYSDWTMRAVPREQYQLWFIGRRAAQSHIEIRERELKEVNDKLAELEKQLSQAETLLQTLEGRRELPALRARLNASLDERPARAQADALEAELRALDMTPVVELENKAKGLRDELARQSKERDDISHKLAVLELELRARQADFEAAKNAQAELERQAATTRAQLPEAVAAAEELLAQSLKQPDPSTLLSVAGQALNEAIRNAEYKEREFETKAKDARQRLTEAAAVYNLSFQFVARPGDPAEARYAEEHRRLTTGDLPRYKAQIANTEHDIEEELRDHVLRRLREQLAEAGRALEQINDALAELPLDGNIYRFAHEPAPDWREFHELIINSEQAGDGPLFESRFYRDHQAAFGKFYEALTAQPRAGLADYRNYLSYGLEVKSGAGQARRLDTNTGAETGIVFYLALAALFARLYRITGREGRPIIRLVACGDAFAKMDIEHIGPALELFRQCKLQLAAATQLERCEYLIPHTSTNVVLTGVGNAVLVEPYRNYEARLDFSDEKQAP
jgi:hypothetical protein